MTFIASEKFPLVPQTLTPAVKWGTPPEHAYVIPEGACYGLPTGPRNGVVVIDLDQKNGKDGLAAISSYAQDLGEDLPMTYTVRTKTGGWHLYFAWEDDRPVGNRQAVLEGVDVRGKGGYVRAGGPYTVAIDVPVAPMPDWLYDLVRSRDDAAMPANPAHAVDPSHPDWTRRVNLATIFVAGEPPCIAGQGGQAQLWKICLRLTRTYELPIETCVELLGPYNERCVPPWKRSELIYTLSNAANKGTGPTGPAPEGWGGPVAPREAPASAPADPTTLVVPADGGPVSSWRQRPDPNHRYSWHAAVDISGQEKKMDEPSQRGLTALFAGPGAAPEWRGVLQYDAFARRVHAVNPPCKLDAETQMGLSDADLLTIRLWLQSAAGMSARPDAVRDAIEAASRIASYHPIAEYLDELPKVPRETAWEYFSTIAARLWGATDRNEMESGYVRRLAIAAVRRIRRPGTKFDIMTVLTGRQGWNKSRFIRYLFGDKYTQDNLKDLGSKEASGDLQGFWGVELAEMAAHTKAEEAVNKRFLSLCEDKYRPPYGHRLVVHPRQCVFIGTTNADEILDDPTGDRRYSVCHIDRPIDLTFDRDEFWACAVALESAGEGTREGTIWPTPEETEATARDNAQHATEDPWTRAVLHFLAQQRDKGVAFVTASDVAQYALIVDLAKQDNRSDLRVKKILRRVCGPSTVQHLSEKGGPQRVYPVPKAP